MATATITKTAVITKPKNNTRRIVVGVLFLALAVIIWFGFVRELPDGLINTYVMTPSASDAIFPDWVFPTAPALNMIAGICAIMGAYQLARGFGKFSNLMIGLAVGLFIFGFLSWASSGGTINLGGLLRVMVTRAVPLTLGALSGVLCERAGVVNIAIEGMMLMAAFVSTVFGSLTNLWGGLIAGILAGMLMGYIHGVLSIKYKINQIISGTFINIFATGMTSFLSSRFLQKPEYQHLNEPGLFPVIEIPILYKIPFVGPILFGHNMYVYAMFIFVFLLTFLLFKTRWGLRHRSVGEHPRAADTLGINVIKTRYIAVLLGGAMAGFAGTYFTLGSVGRFDESMTAGRGFIALAAMIFGNWNPIGSMGAGMLFGFFDSLSTKLSILRVPVPYEFIGMAPYLATMIVLAGVVGKSQAPAADGVPYEKESL
jgi:general nucleoside transport system permease protein